MELSQDTKKVVFNHGNHILILLAKYMPIDFELQQGLPCVFPNLPNLILHITKAGIRA